MRQNTWSTEGFETQLAIAGRIGEWLALTVDDVGFNHEDGPVVTVAATVVTPHSGRHLRQPDVKSGLRGRREVVVSP